jgi:hypothetical protein
MNIYYAHCMAIYHTPQENRDVAALEELGFTVVNPNSWAVKESCEAVTAKALRDGTDTSHAVMEAVFKPLVESCDALAFRALPDGSIPAGVSKEICWAKEAGLNIVELPAAVNRRTLSIDQTRAYLAEIGQR